MNASPVSVYLCLGSNMGDRRKNLRLAMEFLSQRLNITKTSSVYDTEPEENPDQPRFLNLVCHATTYLQPADLLALLKGIEHKMGRVPAKANSPRPIDIDILFYGEETMAAPDLVIPHPKLSQRAFVLVPLNEIAPGLVHPVSKKKVRQHLAELKHGVQGVFKFVEPEGQGEKDV
jgi:2-amino-4-hydroxy-6-hydroxymethyldihydropteridine diphosphokinase